MKPTRIPRRLLAVAALLLVVVAVPLWPAGLGGSTSYVVTHGASMRPAYSDGDLAIVRRHDRYRIGDVAAYRSKTVHRVVVHRIVAMAGDTFTFKGDANSFQDPEQVSRTAVLGRVALHLPVMGSALLWLTHPFNVLLLVVLSALVWWDRARLLDLVRRGGAPAAPASTAPVHQPQMPVDEPIVPSWDARIDRSRVVTISDLSFPHELAVADVVAPDDLTRLAERYDRPILHDAASEVLFVVETGMLYRCAVPAELPQETPAALAIVRDLVVEPRTAQEPAVAPDSLDGLFEAVAEVDVVEEPEPAALEQSEDVLPAVAAPSRPKWYERQRIDRRHTPQGRDWGYGGKPVHAPDLRSVR